MKRWRPERVFTFYLFLLFFTEMFCIFILHIKTKAMKKILMQCTFDLIAKERRAKVANALIKGLVVKETKATPPITYVILEDGTV